MAAKPQRKRCGMANKDLQSAFRFLNHKFFDSRLHPTIRVRWGNLHKKEANGLWRPYDRDITIDYSLRKTGWNPIYIFMLHEMVHADLESATDGYVGYHHDGGHGTRFQGEICRLWRQGAYDGLL